MEQAAAKGANVICLPELCATGYYLPSIEKNLDQVTEKEDGSTVTALCRLAKKYNVYIVGGFIRENSKGEKPYNSAVFINDDGSVQGFYNKIHMFGRESNVFCGGSGCCVFETRYGKLGVIICYDNNFPETARATALLGADVILCPCAWRTEEKEIFELLAKSHACENTVYFAAVNICKTEKELNLFGGSVAVNPCGNVIAKADNKESVITANICEKLLKQCRRSMPFLQDRQAKAYKIISQE